jgi:hypothetical protein
VSQRDQRIDVDRAARRHIASEYSDGEKKQGDSRESERIRRPYAVKQSGH